MGLSRSTAARLAWGSAGLTAICFAAATAVFVIAGPPSSSAPPSQIEFDAATLVGAIAGSVGFLVFAVVGALIASRRPDNAIGWLFCGAGLATGIANLAGAYGYWGLIAHPASLSGAAFGELVSDTLYTPTIPLTTTFLFLLFPDGRLPSRRWRPVFWAAIAGAAVGALGNALAPTLYGLPTVENPVVALPAVVAESIGGVGFLFVVITLVASVVSLILRLRRSEGEERQQLKWFAYASVFALVFLLPSFLSDNPPPTLIILSTVAAFAIPASVGAAILKYRLYDIDVVINKTVVYGTLAAFITAVYVGIVVGIGTLAGRGDEPNVALSIVATAVVAVGFQPVRQRVQHLANRLVYGKRATPYEVLSEFSERMAGTYATEDLLPRMAGILAEGTGAARTEVWLRVGTELRPDAWWPQEDTPRDAVPLAGDELPAIQGVDLAVPVRHQGELLGTLTVTKKPGESLTPTEVKLISDLASQAGLVLRNVGLTEQLIARLEDLKASRQRLVAAQDEERRRLERDLHDGAQQQLVALAVRLRMAETLIEKDAAKARDALAQVQADAQDALENLRDLARGIYPPLLADKGLAAALEAQARKAPVPVRVEANNLGRFAPGVEATVYFCVLEALQNVAKYATASKAAVGLSQRNGVLMFEVADDGVGFDPATTPRGSGLQNIADRLAALNGTLEIRSAPASGTTVTGRLPARTLEMSP